MKFLLGVTLTLLAFGPLLPVAVAAEPGTVGIEAGKEQINFLVGKELVGRYNIAPGVAKPYFFPLYVPGGAPVPITRSWPMVKGVPGETNDHPHQKSLWFCHGDVIPKGIELKDKVKGVEGVDFWSETPGHGVIVCKEVGTPKLEKNHGQVTTQNVWQTADGTKIMDETRTIHLYDFGDARLLVFDIDLHASVTAITFGDTKEGSFGIRINDAIREAEGKAAGKGKLENAKGEVGEKLIWGNQSPWCDYSGPLHGKTVGLAIFDDPANSPKACWHSRGYGLMAANPFGRDKSFPSQKGNTKLVELPRGEHLKLRYGVLLHTGDAREGKVAEYYDQFVKLKN